MQHGHRHGTCWKCRIIASPKAYRIRILILTRYSGISQVYESLGSTGLHSLFRTPLHAPWAIFWDAAGALTTPSTDVPLPSPFSCLKSPMAPCCLQDQVQASWPGTTGIFVAGPKLTFSTYSSPPPQPVATGCCVLSHHFCPSSFCQLGCPSPLLTLPT